MAKVLMAGNVYPSVIAANRVEQGGNQGSQKNPAGLSMCASGRSPADISDESEIQEARIHTRVF